MHSPFDLDFSLFLFLNLKLILSFSQLCIFIISQFSKAVCSLSSEPCSNSALNVKSRIFSLLCPHLWWEIVFVWSYYLIISGIHEESSNFTLFSKSNIHLHPHFSHHNCWFSFVFVGLNNSLVLLRMIVWLLIGLGESMMVMLTCSIVSNSTKVWFLFIGFLNFNCHTFDLKFKNKMC